MSSTEVTLKVFDGYGHEWTVKVYVPGDPMENEEAYALCDQAALEASNVWWEVLYDDA